MNSLKLKSTATKLRHILDKYSAFEPVAVVLKAQLQDLLDNAERGGILSDVEIRDIPGYKVLTETTLQGHSDLSEAYAAFYIELTGGESEALRVFKLRHKGHR
ncbi:hypothetical protein [Pseudomonas sp. RIT-PI-S]|uniref:hypothetical protein n=1 Tax=Pseudomonas sp. RIT-PI-S TaxID=3035295 RepID=UPI0021D8F8D6|nr:hypothetical protein [Pseudomonas sp. RIT-PI-S]